MESGGIHSTPFVDVFVTLSWLVLVKNVRLPEKWFRNTRNGVGPFCQLSGCSTLVEHECPCSSFEKCCTPVTQKREREKERRYVKKSLPSRPASPHRVDGNINRFCPGAGLT